MKYVFLLFPLLTWLSDASATELSFRQKYILAAQDMVPLMQIKNCNTKTAKGIPSKYIIECNLVINNSLLTLDVLNNKLIGVWLMYDASKLEKPADLMRVGGMLLRALRGTNAAGDHLAVASNLYSESYKKDWKKTCVIDSEGRVLNFV